MSFYYKFCHKFGPKNRTNNPKAHAKATPKYIKEVKAKQIEQGIHQEKGENKFVGIPII
jgi:hypothetical protein